MRRREGKLETQLFTTNGQEGRNISHSGQQQRRGKETNRTRRESLCRGPMTICYEYTKNVFLVLTDILKLEGCTSVRKEIYPLASSKLVMDG
jgi:hypothetical protein